MAFTTTFVPTASQGHALMQKSMDEAYSQNTAAQQQVPNMAQQFIDEYQRAYDEARAANEQRYQEILGGYEQRYTEAMASLEGLGEQQRADVSRRWDMAATGGAQDLVSRGLGGTTIGPTMAMGYEREKSADMRRLEDQLTREKLGYQTGLSGEQLAFQERREDVYPDPAMLMNLMNTYGQYGMGAARAPVGYSTGGGGSPTTAPAPVAHDPFTAAVMKYNIPANVTSVPIPKTYKKPTTPPSPSPSPTSQLPAGYYPQPPAGFYPQPAEFYNY